MCQINVGKNEATGIPSEVLESFLKQVLLREGVGGFDASAVSQGLLDASLRGVDSHGIRLFAHYLAAVRGGRVNPRPAFSLQCTKSGTGVLDADHGFGHAAGKKAVEHVKELATINGIGAVSVKNSTHFGAAAYFGNEIARSDMLGLCFTNSDPLIPPTGSSEPFLGNNPICFTAPILGEDPFCLDMATSQITFNEVLRLRASGESAPAGAGYDQCGYETVDPKKIVSLAPVGGYKGYGLSLMVEILCSLLAQMPYGPNVGHMYNDTLEKRRHLSHFFLAVDIGSFLDIEKFKTHIAALAGDLRNQIPVDSNAPIQIAGDPEKLCREQRLAYGIPISEVEVELFDQLSDLYGISWRESSD